MPTNKQRRDAARRHLERQLAHRQEREARRRRVTLISSVAATVVLIGAVVAIILGLGGGNSNKSAAGSSGSATASPSVSASASASASPSASSSTGAALAAPVACTELTGKATVSFRGVTVKNADNLKKAPKVTSSSASAPPRLECADLVVGKGKAATASSTVQVQYLGALYKNGSEFDSSWSRGGKPISFSLAQVVPGFTQGIGGTGKLGPMHVGGRRLMILPASLGYGAQANASIPANSALVFVVDLVKVS